jgi:choline-sulfatase
VLLVTIDTMRADRLGRGFTPTLDALAREGVRFTEARATVPLTLPSHATILTGTLPPEHGVRENGTGRFDGSLPTLPGLLRDRGYQTAAFIGAFVLDRRFGLDHGFDHYDDHIPRDATASTRLEADRPAADVVGAALRWLEAADRARPSFVWVHLYDPHAPYTPPAEYLDAARGHPYDGEIAYADAQVGVLLNAVRLHAGGNLLIAVTSDHGEGLGEHGEATHGMLAYDSTLRVPLILAGREVDRGTTTPVAVSLRDLAPTLLGLVGAPTPQAMTGTHLPVRAGKPADAALPSEIYAETIYPAAAGWSPLRVLVDGRWKLIASSTRELYDVASDPGERRELSAQHPNVAAAMEAHASRIFASGTRTTGPLTGEAADRLRALGYVAAAPAPMALPSAANPRDAIAAWNRFEEALALAAGARSPEALPALKALADQHPGGRVFQAAYANALRQSGRARDAQRIHRAIVARWPDDPTAFHDLAVAARDAGDRDEALRAQQAALALSPQDPTALNGLGLIHSDAGRHEDAARAFEKATAADPANAAYTANLGNARRALGDLTGAERAYRRALEIDAGHADAANGLGVIHVQQRRAAEAIAWFERALRADPGSLEAQLNLGIAYQESGQIKRAAEQYRKVIAAAPGGSGERKAAQELLAALRE